MGLFGNGNIKTSMFLVEGLPSSFKAVIRMELDKKAQKLLFKLPQEKEFRELPFSQILYARRDRLIDKQKELNELALKIIYKLHPNEYRTWKLLHPQLKESNIEVIDNNAKDLYYYFSIATHQIGVSSTALYEGLAFHLNTIIYKAYRYDMMVDLVHAGYAKLAANLEEVMELITKSNESDLSLKDFWKQNAKKNLKEALFDH